MKKVLLVVAFAFTMFFGLVNVNAASESDLIAKLSQGYAIGSETVKASDYQISEAKRYLNKYDVSATDADYIIAKIDEIYAVAKGENAKSFTDLSSTAKSKIVSLVAEVSNNTSVKVSLTNNGVLTVFESDGKTPFTEIKDADITKQTGTNNIAFVIASVIAVVGIAYVAKKAIKENA